MGSAILIVLFALLCSLSGGYAVTYNVISKRLNSNLPVLTFQQAGASVFNYNYNTAYVPLFDGDRRSSALLVRCQNATTDEYTTTPSVLALTNLNMNNLLDMNAEPITAKSVVVQPESSTDAFGTEDPRVVYDHKDGTYYLLYSAVQSKPVISKLSLATTKTPFNASSWVRHGPVLPDAGWSKSGSLLIRPSAPHYLFWGDSNTVCGLSVATSNDLLNWTNIHNGTFLPCRPKGFDANLVEGGPMPLPLSDGNYLYIYNSARHGFPSAKPNWDMQYNVGWAILDGTDPTKVLQRCDTPLLSPELAWEIGTKPFLGLTPNVVFIEGWTQLGQNSFVAFYGAADSVIGALAINVDITK
eukprot:TRINITY_DN1673_c0_g1_i2.p1 TRINITY_DN1673_c0_g1~~TRINITY_DN1673_c0_g1_i2.p1  ORF type:complete len:370 (+),score=95.27 TRINITY_DN1673_c0_g1_i2:44-1111(+)